MQHGRTKRVVLWACPLLASCGPLSGSDPEFWEPGHDLGGVPFEVPGGAAAGGMAAAGGGTGGFPMGGDEGGLPVPPPAAADCDMTFEATTITAGGRYGPWNVGAVWVSDPQGQFVKTLRTWGGPIRLPNAATWRSESGYNAVDAVTGATRPAHGPVSAFWDCTDLTSTPVPAATYWISITFAEDNAIAAKPPPLHVARVAVDIQARPMDRVFDDQPNFSAMSVSLQ